MSQAVVDIKGQTTESEPNNETNETRWTSSLPHPRHLIYSSLGAKT